ncbi:MAG: rubrerythrin [Clostridium sp.]
MKFHYQLDIDYKINYCNILKSNSIHDIIVRTFRKFRNITRVNLTQTQIRGGLKLENLKTIETGEDLLKSFAEESLVKNRYAYYASVAKKEGFIQIEKFFNILELNEKEVTVSENLLVLDNDENEQWSTYFPSVAEDDDFSDIPFEYRKIYEVEKISETVFIKNETVLWKCSHCRVIFEDSCIPEVCPACDHPNAYFENVADI